MVRFRMMRPWSPDDDKMLVSLLMDHPQLTMDRIAVKLNRTKAAVKSRAAKYGLGSTAARTKGRST
jgi:hypothetical protein